MNLEVMTEIAQPLDQWCVFNCGRLATVESADGVLACEDCARQVIEAEAKYAAEAAESAIQLSGRKVGQGSRNPRLARQAKAKAKRRAKRKRTGR